MRWFTFGGRCIYTSPSGYKVYDNYLFRWLTLNSKVLQTAIYKRKPHRPVLYYLPALTLMARTNPGSCCILGLGGAGAIQVLAPTNTLTVIENSNEVIDIARQFFMLERLTPLNIIHQSAEIFLEHNTVQYDHLLVDLYNAHCFPPECCTELFFKNCKKNLTSDGFLAVNLANSKQQHTLLKLIQKHFSNTLVLPVKKSANLVIIAANCSSQDAFINAVSKSHGLKKVSFVESWGCVALLK